jgi:hypothetical protein
MQSHFAHFVRKLVGVSMLGLLLSGCATQPTLYQWGSYQPQVYTYLRGEGAGYPEQIAALEADIQKARAANRPLPPGFNAHLGMLHGQVGQWDKMAMYFQAEKTLYPESAPFMDFLLKTKKK